MTPTSSERAAMQTPATIRQNRYLDDGLYEFECMSCHGFSALNMSFHWFTAPDVISGSISLIPKTWGLHYCGHCGVKFERFEFAPDYFTKK